MKKYRMRLIIYAVILVGIVSLLSLSCFNTWQMIYKNKKEKLELETKYASLVEKEDNLSSEVVKLQDPEYVAKFAREKYLYTKEDELIIDMSLMDE